MTIIRFATGQDVCPNEGELLLKYWYNDLYTHLRNNTSVPDKMMKKLVDRLLALGNVVVRIDRSVNPAVIFSIGCYFKQAFDYYMYSQEFSIIIEFPDRATRSFLSKKEYKFEANYSAVDGSAWTVTGNSDSLDEFKRSLEGRGITNITSIRRLD